MYRALLLGAQRPLLSSIRTILGPSVRRRAQRHYDTTTLLTRSRAIGGASFSTTTTSTVTAATGGTQYDAPPPGVTVVADRAAARRAVELLQRDAKERGDAAYHACDTEVIDLDLNNESVVGHGRVICVSFYAGSHLDFGSGPRLWVDTLDGEDGVLQEFSEYFASRSIRKVWHNYSFDRHVLQNHGLAVHGLGADTIHMARLWDTSRLQKEGYSLSALTGALLNRPKITMKELFGKPAVLKDGSEGKAIIVPALEELQRNTTNQRNEWIEYSVYDAQATWELRNELETRLRNMQWQDSRSLYDFYVQYWVPFAELLTDMEHRGIYVDTQYLASLEPKANEDIRVAEERFRQWAVKYCEAAKYMNVSSGPQKQHFLFAPATNRISGEVWPRERIFKIENVHGVVEDGKKKALKHMNLALQGLGIPAVAYTASGWPAVTAAELRKLAGSPPKYGPAYEFFGGGDEGAEACEAIGSLCHVSTISTLLNTFILPLQQQVDAESRVHASLNINTETGRLSCRNPNLQNQPALDKDIYKIRKAFTCKPGNTLIVADYGQLELRLLAHISSCRSMLHAFAVGGDFHSRTAMGMYPEIAKKLETGEVLLEWDSSKGQAPAPLLKDVYSTERRKAKMLNFSIAYGKTAMGLAKDWAVSLDQAKETVERWYNDRPEVRKWQRETIEEARRTGYTKTLMGRWRKLDDINNRNPRMRAHAERAAINTPLQGGAADIVMKAMLLLHHNERLSQLGWHILLQIHDELILEGPRETRDEAMQLVVNTMRNPVDPPLQVELVVDANSADTWLEAK